MARPRGAKNKPKLAPVGGDAPGMGHNALTDEQQQKLHLNSHVPAYERALKAKKDADAHLKNVCKMIKSEGGSLQDVKDTIAMRDDPDAEVKLKAEFERKLKVARWNGLAVGTQGDLFGPDRRPADERAFDDGKRAGMKGETCKPSHSPGSVEAEKWIEGWHAGQAVLAGGFKQGPDELLREEGKPSDGQPDAFDDAAAAGEPGSGDNSAGEEGRASDDFVDPVDED